MTNYLENLLNPPRKVPMQKSINKESPKGLTRRFTVSSVLRPPSMGVIEVELQASLLFSTFPYFLLFPRVDASDHQYRESVADIEVVVVVYFILSRLLYLAFSANLGLLYMPHPGMGPLV